jgi:hypothetical protein
MSTTGLPPRKSALAGGKRAAPVLLWQEGAGDKGDKCDKCAEAGARACLA